MSGNEVVATSAGESQHGGSSAKLSLFTLKCNRKVLQELSNKCVQNKAYIEKLESLLLENGIALPNKEELYPLVADSELDSARADSKKGKIHMGIVQDANEFVGLLGVSFLDLSYLLLR